MTYREDGSEDRSILVVAGMSQIRAYDRATGDERWAHDLRYDSWLGKVAQSAVIDLVVRGGRVIAVMSSRILCLEYRTGKLIGEIELTGPAHARPSVLADGDQLYVAVHGVLECITMTGERLWSVKTVEHAEPVAIALPGNVRLGDRDSRG